MAKYSYIGQDALFRYLKEKRGLSQTLSKILLKDIIDFIICSLCLREKVGLSYLGTFTIIPNEHYGGRLKYRPSKKLKEIIKDYVLEKREDLLDKEDIDLVTFSKDEDFPLNDWEVDLSSEDIGKQKGTKGNLVRRSFLTYLKEYFPHGEDWKHPISNHYYSFDLIKEKLKVYRREFPENYSLLWALWTSQKSRIILSEQYKLSPSTVQRRWSEAVDCILTFLQFPELEPQVPLDLHNGL